MFDPNRKLNTVARSAGELFIANRKIHNAVGYVIRFAFDSMRMRGRLQPFPDGCFKDGKPFHGTVFSYIGEGAQITSMAQLALTTKQNMSYLVKYLVDLGYVESDSDEKDGRAKIFRLTDKGIRCRAVTMEILSDIAAEWELLIGKEKMTQLNGLLLELNEKLEGKMPFK